MRLVNDNEGLNKKFLCGENLDKLVDKLIGIKFNEIDSKAF